MGGLHWLPWKRRGDGARVGDDGVGDDGVVD